MRIGELLNELGYAGSPFFLKKGTRAFANARNFGHILRAAASSKQHAEDRPDCGLQGVYTLNNLDDLGSASTPIVYVCKAKTEAEADEIHRLVWNQDITPFLIVLTNKGIKFYSGFEYSGSGNGHLTQLLAFNTAMQTVREFHADEIDSGRFWKGWSNRLRPECRVNWRLLHNLKSLDEYLQQTCELPRKTSHALIGKYVYLHYLRDRDILSDRKLESWDVTDSQIFGSSASVTKLKLVVRELENWLNGNIFPIPFSGKDAAKSNHVQLVAGIFSGDDISKVGDRQLSLNFKAYDFSYIPIETLSVVYEQFLHTPDEAGKSQGKEEGAYYTPIPVVNYMLTEMEEALPLEEGMQVFDPACGSGAFLVQCYRRLIEKTYPHHEHPTIHPIPLRDLLVESIFGLDRDEDACSVTELSLLMTLLDYVDPPDLEDDKRVKLPTLRGKNVFQGDFFNPLPAQIEETSFHWIAGNPPWKKLISSSISTKDQPVWRWICGNKHKYPVGDNQVAQAFAWKVSELTDSEGEIGLFMPSMTLFADKAEPFRKSFFSEMKLKSVANFSNLAEVISAGRFRVPSAALFYSPCTREDSTVLELEKRHVQVYSPLVANQEQAKPEITGKRVESWSIVVNESEIRDLSYKEVASGSSLPWKTASWGSHHDISLLERVEKCFPSLLSLQNKEVITISEGPGLRNKLVASGRNKSEYREELVEKNVLSMSRMRGLRDVFKLPENAAVPNVKHYLYLCGSEDRKLSVCRGPHVIANVARTFACYEEEYLIVPKGQVGIVSPNGDREFLKSLSLFLSSDFAFYHQFFSASQFGVQRRVATLDALKQMPCPITELTKAELRKWVALHSKLVKTTPRKVGQNDNNAKSLFPNNELDDLLVGLNDLVSDSLGLSEKERALVSDFVNIRLELNDGKVGQPAIKKPSAAEIKRYGVRLQKELDEFLGKGSKHRHAVEIIYDQATGMICVDFLKFTKKLPTSVKAADNPTAKSLARTREELREEIGQWVYFDRDLRIHDGTKTYLFKPMQRFHWTESQAMIDASELIAETVSAEGAPA